MQQGQTSTLLSNNYIAITNVLFTFMRSFDVKGWDTMADCLSEQIYCDYSSFRKEQPGYITRDYYVQLRIAALTNLITQHNLFNLTMSEIADQTVAIKCNYCIYRFLQAKNSLQLQHFHSYGTYEFSLINSDKWRICSIIQKLLINDGNLQIHSGVKSG